MLTWMCVLHMSLISAYQYIPSAPVRLQPQAVRKSTPRPLTVANQYKPLTQARHQPQVAQKRTHSGLQQPATNQNRDLSIYTFTQRKQQTSGYQYNPPQKPVRLEANANRKPTPPLVGVLPNQHKLLKTVYEAKSLEFTFPSDQELLATLADGRYDPNNVLPIDVDVYVPNNGRAAEIYLTIPRFDRGSPYTLARVRNAAGNRGIQLEAFPSYAWHSSYGANCDGLTSVYRVKIDPCNRMWILDSGEIGRNHTCPPQVVVFDLLTHRVVHRYRLPGNVYTRNFSRLVTITIDVADPPPLGQCSKAFAYIADATAFSLIIYDAANQRSWRAENRYTYPNPQFSKHTIAGESFELLDGIFAMSLTPNGLGLRRMLYFHSLSNDLEVSVPLDVINNATNFLTADLSSSLNEFIELGSRGTQCTVSEMTPQGYLLCVFFDPIALIGWDIRTPYTAQNRVILAQSPETLQFIGGLKIAANERGKLEVWLLSNRAQKFFSGTNNLKEINYRIMKCGLDELLSGQPC